MVHFQAARCMFVWQNLKQACYCWQEKEITYAVGGMIYDKAQCNNTSSYKQQTDNTMRLTNDLRIFYKKIYNMLQLYVRN